MRCKSGTAKKIQGVSIKRRLPLPLAHYLAACSLRNRMAFQAAKDKSIRQKKKTSTGFLLEIYLYFTCSIFKLLPKTKSCQ